MARTARVKAIYQNGMLQLLEPLALPEGMEVWVELLFRPQSAVEPGPFWPARQPEPSYPIRPQPPETLARLIGLLAVGGDALADSEALYDADWH